MEHIVIATDGSPAAHEAVELGVELARDRDADVTFVHVVPPDEFAAAAGMAPPVPRPEPVDSDTALAAAAETARSAGVPHALVRVADDTVDAIIGIAEELDADLIVAGSRRQGAVRAALLGSVSRRLVRNAERPVVVVKASGRVPAAV